MNTNTKYDSLVSFAVKAAFHKYNICHAVSFHSNNNRASPFADIYRDVSTYGDGSSNNNGNDTISVFNVNGKMSACCREQILNDARNSFKSILTNCKVLSMGVDESHWNLVVMADPVESDVSSRQMIGRVSRKAPGKECGYALIPVPVMDDGFDNGSYNNYILLVKYKAREGNCKVPQGHKEDEENLGVWLNTQRINKKKGTLVDVERIRQLEELGIVWKFQ
jgi:predicted helicase